MKNIIEISSTQNDLVKYCAKLQDSKFRKQERVILLDGDKTIESILNSGMTFSYLFIKKDNQLQRSAKCENLVFVNDEILKKISTTKSPAASVGIIKEPEYKKEEFKKISKIALIDSIKDAGNLGTIIRSAAAFDIGGIILYGDCVDLYNSKVIRASAQNMFKIPVITENNLLFIKELKKDRKLISTVVNSKNDFLKYSFEDKFILAFGSEAMGLSDEIINLSDDKVTFFMDNNVESLNLAVFASIAFSFIKIKNNLKN